MAVMTAVHWACLTAEKREPSMAVTKAAQKAPLMAAMTVSRMAYSKAGLKVP